jgi:membrane carboxypeptidase/penicillin-binding protein PbpC
MIENFFEGKIMKRKIEKLSILIVFSSLAFTGCFSPWKGDETALTLLLGNTGCRAAANDEAVLQIELTGPTGRQSHTVEGNKPFSVTVMPGYWEITVKAFLDGALYAEGSGGADIKAGKNTTVEIQMIPVTVGISINFNKDGTPDVSADNFTISRSEQEQFTVTVNGEFIDIRWLIWGYPVSGSEGRKKITIKAEDYNPGAYQLVVSVIDENGVPYSAEIAFTVTE